MMHWAKCSSIFFGEFSSSCDGRDWDSRAGLSDDAGPVSEIDGGSGSHRLHHQFVQCGGRFFWASSSDYLGRRNTYTLFFVVQFALFLWIPGIAAAGSWSVFLACLFTVFTMYGGGFATIPAFLADIFGAENVGAIHGAVLTAWSAAAITGPLIITQLSNRAGPRSLPAPARCISTTDLSRCSPRCLQSASFLRCLYVQYAGSNAQRNLGSAKKDRCG